MRMICFAALLLSLIVPAARAEETVLNVAPDKPEIVRLDQEAASVIVGSPKYASVTLDSPTTLLVMPRAEGATSLTVLNKRGDIIMEKRLIVGGPQDNYVRIRRACTATMAGCVTSQLYYCPNGCSEISLGDQQGDKAPTGQTTTIPMTANPANPPALPDNIPQVDAADLEEPAAPVDKPK